MTLPKMMPMPTPAPTAPRPPPTPRAIALPAAEPASDCPKTVRTGRSRSSTEWLLLVMLGDRAAEIDGRERGEDERLQRRDQADLENEESDRERQRDPPERLDPQQHREAAGHEQDDQVAGEDVGEKTDGERDEPHEVREELEHEDEHGHPPGHPTRDQALQVPAQTLRADPLDVVGDEDDDRQRQRD